jgi:hypothetical protein
VRQLLAVGWPLAALPKPLKRKPPLLIAPLHFKRKCLTCSERGKSRTAKLVLQGKTD